MEFRTSKKGLVLTASLPRTAKSIDAIQLTFKLTNSTDAMFSFQEMEGILEGMRFKLQDSSGNMLPMTENGKAAMGHFAMATHHEYLNAHQTMIISVPIKEYILIKDAGKYTLTVSWGEEGKFGEDPYTSPHLPTLQLNGAFLLKNYANGISISAAN